VAGILDSKILEIRILNVKLYGSQSFCIIESEKWEQQAHHNVLLSYRITKVPLNSDSLYTSLPFGDMTVPCFLSTLEKDEPSPPS